MDAESENIGAGTSSSKTSSVRSYRCPVRAIAEQDVENYPDARTRWACATQSVTATRASSDGKATNRPINRLTSLSRSPPSSMSPSTGTGGGGDLFSLFELSACPIATREVFRECHALRRLRMLAVRRDSRQDLPRIADSGLQAARDCGRGFRLAETDEEGHLQQSIPHFLCRQGSGNDELPQGKRRSVELIISCPSWRHHKSAKLAVKHGCCVPNSTGEPGWRR